MSSEWRGLVAAAGIRLVGTDLDGTLLRRDSSVSGRTVAALARARDVGLPVVFVTGRPPRWMPPVVDVTGHAGIGVCANGAIVIDLDRHEVIETHPISPDAIDEVVSVLRAEVPGVGFAAEWVDADGSTSFGHEHSYRPRWEPAEPVERVDDVRAFVEGHAIVKLLARVHADSPAAAHDVDALLEVTLGHVSHLVEATHSASDDVLIEMSALGVSKGAALAAQAARLGVPSDAVAAVGDMPNDVPMLAWAGVGLAVADAHPAARAAADAVLPSPDDDGVAQLVEAALEALGA